MVRAVVALGVAALALGFLLSGCPDPASAYKTNQGADNASSQPSGEDTSGGSSDQGTGDQGMSDGTSNDTGTGGDGGGGTDFVPWHFEGSWAGKVQCTMETSFLGENGQVTQTTSDGEYTVTFAEDGRPLDVAITAALGGSGENITVTQVGETTAVTMSIPSLGPNAVMSQTITVTESDVSGPAAHLAYEYRFEVTGADNLTEEGTGWQTFDWLYNAADGTLSYTTTATYDVSVTGSLGPGGQPHTLVQRMVTECKSASLTRQ